MGALHGGHLSLVRQARSENDRVVVSIFVNPLQFGAGEDLARYPRPLEHDFQVLVAEGVDAVYLPRPADMYPPDSRTRIRVLELGDVLEGLHRPGHFEGVATVVAKLFNAVRPHSAYFGQKDAQQVAVVSRLAADLDTGVEIRVGSTVREPDGLALSSRNAYLREPERRAASCLFRALRAANNAHLTGERDPARLRQAMAAVLANETLVTGVDYADLVDPITFLPPGGLAVLAVVVGTTRLIDNHLLGEPLGV